MLDGAPPLELPRIDGNKKADVIIVGAGIAGLSIAYALINRGLKVVVIDKGPVGGGQSKRTTAHVSYAFDDGFNQLQNIVGIEGSRAITLSQRIAWLYMKNIVETEKIDCDFMTIPGYLYEDGESALDLKAEFHAAKEAKVPGIEWIDTVPELNKGPAIFFPLQAQIHLQKYMNALARIIIEKGGEIYCNTYAVGKTIEKDKSIKVHAKWGNSALKAKRSRILTSSEDYTLSAKHLVVATHGPASALVDFKAPQTKNRTYVISLEVPKGKLAPALYWNTRAPYNHIRIKENPQFFYDDKGRPQGDNCDHLILGGEDHPVSMGIQPKRYDRLEKYARSLFPFLGKVVDRWQGAVYEPPDYVGYIGQIQPGSNIYVCTGDSGHGILQATLGSLLIRDLILGYPNEWEKWYLPYRPQMTEGKKKPHSTSANFTDEKTPPNESFVMEPGSLSRHEPPGRHILGPKDKKDAPIRPGCNTAPTHSPASIPSKAIQRSTAGRGTR